MTLDELTAFIVGICDAQDGLCMDVPSERHRLARAVGTALYRHR
jgi:hypothetical protein